MEKGNLLPKRAVAFSDVDGQSLLWHWEGSADALRYIGDSVTGVVDNATYVAAGGTGVGCCNETARFEMGGEVAEDWVDLFDWGCENGRGQEAECADDGLKKLFDLGMWNNGDGSIGASMLIV
jgi:hypothetical protein